MKTKILTLICVLAISFGFTFKSEPLQTGKLPKPRLCIDNYSKELSEGTLINCRKIKDLGVVVYLNAELEKYDVFQVELHRFGTDGDVMVAYQSFIPSNKDYQKKVAGKDSLQLGMINPMDTNNNGFETNTLVFKADKYIIESVVCMIHELQHCNFYVVIKGYNKTGKINKFGDEVFDKGVDVSERSISFRNWEKK